ncbi:hypothetical protein AADR41_01425 [Streptomyces sp. CLV115]|uniref:hypothetical protein n=1 Tax=Streptomyces sp. CLV115 TaxID=3138502 RepID=UPI00313D788E
MVLDARSLHAAAGVPAGTTGRDAAKEVPGRATSGDWPLTSCGLVIAVVVLVASVHDNAFGAGLPDEVATGTEKSRCE